MAPSPAAAALPADVAAIADEIFVNLGSGRQIAPFTSRPGGLTLDDAYRVTALLDQKRQARGERRLGRKIGFTNRTIWQQYNVYAPIWGYVYDSTVHDLDQTATLPLAGLPEPRIEPEIVFGLGAVPAPDMDDAALIACIDWVAHGFEIVQSLFPDWKFLAADTVAVDGLHGALLIGPRHKVGPHGAEWQKTLADFTIELSCDGSVVDRGVAANVLDGPLSALRHFVGLLADDAVNHPLEAGEIVTTGTLTRAMPVRASETWSTTLSGIALDGIRLHFV
jgi:2-keto-4-pentenoate hydratase